MNRHSVSRFIDDSNLAYFTVLKISYNANALKLGKLIIFRHGAVGFFFFQIYDSFVTLKIT